MAVEIVEMNSYVDAADALWFVGAVRNTGAVAVDGVRVDVTLRDAAGAVTAEGFGYTAYSPVRPGELAPFTVLFQQGPAWADYEVTVEANPYRADLAYRSFSTTVTQEGPTDFYLYTITGEVTNAGGTPAEFVRVTALLYDAEGRVIGWASDSIDEPAVLPPGQSAPFDITVVGAGGEVARYELFTTGLRADDALSLFDPMPLRGR
jgi:hypothetical protein